jgi:hypothetical protein
MKGFYLAQEGHPVLALPPQDVNGGVSANRFKMNHHGHASIIVAIGASAAAATKILVHEADAESDGNKNAIGFDYFAETTANGDTLGAKQAVSAAGVTPTANDNVFYVIEIDASALSDGFDWIEVEITNASGNSVLASVVAVLSGARYSGDQSATAIA